MIRALVLLVFGVLGPSLIYGAVQPSGESIVPEQRVFIETAAARDQYFVSEPIRIRVRIGIDSDFLRDNLIQLFRRELDVPVQLRASWLDELTGAENISRSASDESDGSSFSLNDGMTKARRVEDRAIDGRTFSVFEIEAELLPTQAGELAIPESRLRFAYATEFEESFIHGKMPRDRRDAEVVGEALTIEVRPLPDDGRPSGFTGAVGRFTVEADAASRDVEVGQTFELELRIEGEGNFGSFEAPPLDDLDGFHVYGRIEEKGQNRRTIRYELSPLHARVTEVPAIPFGYFDSGPPAGYRIAETSPIPLEVRGLPGAETDTATEADTEDAERSDGVDRDSAMTDFLPVIVGGSVVLGAGLVVVLLLVRARRRHSESADVESVLAPGAAAAFRDRDGAELSHAFAAYIAAHLHCKPPAVIDPNLAGRLTSVGVPPELAARSGALMESIVAARYGGPPPSGADESARILVDELEAAFKAASRRAR